MPYWTCSIHIEQSHSPDPPTSQSLNWHCLRLQRVSKPESLRTSLLSWLAPRGQRACLALMISGLPCSSLAFGNEREPYFSPHFLQRHWFLSAVLTCHCFGITRLHRIHLGVFNDFTRWMQCQRFSSGNDLLASQPEMSPLCRQVVSRFCPTYVPQQLTGLWENIFIVQLFHSLHVYSIIL